MSITLPTEATGTSTIGPLRQKLNAVIRYLGFTDSQAPGESKIYPYFEDFIHNPATSYSTTGVLAGIEQSQIGLFTQVNRVGNTSTTSIVLSPEFWKDKFIGRLKLRNAIADASFVQTMFSRAHFIGGLDQDINGTSWVRNVDFHFRINFQVSVGQSATFQRKAYVGLFGMDPTDAKTVDSDTSTDRRWIGLEYNCQSGPNWFFRKDLGSAIGTDAVNSDTGIKVASERLADVNAYDNIVVSFRDGLPVIVYLNGVEVGQAAWSDITSLSSLSVQNRPMRPVIYVSNNTTSSNELITHVDYFGADFKTEARPFQVVPR